MEFINGIAAGALNPFQSAAEAVGLGDALYGTGYAIDKATMYGIAPLSADGKWSAIEKLDRLAGVEKNIVNAVRDWSAENPNAAETVEAAFNAAAVAKAAKLAKTGTGKAAVSEDFSDANRSYSQHIPIKNYIHTEYNGKSAITDGRYVTDPIGMDRHKPITAPSGKSVFKSDIDAEKATLDAARYADKHNLWNEHGKAKVPTKGIIGYTNGQPTQIINVYRGKPNRNGISPIHGSPGKE